MTPEKFFDYLEGNRPAAGSAERSERPLISDPELQKQFVAARQIHRGLQRPINESSATTRAGSRGRQLAAAFAVLVAMNVALGARYFPVEPALRRSAEGARGHAPTPIGQSSLEKSAAAAFTPPTLGVEPIRFTVPRTKQDEVAQAVIAAATKTGGSGTKGLPAENETRVLCSCPLPPRRNSGNAHRPRRSGDGVRLKRDPGRTG